MRDNVMSPIDAKELISRLDDNTCACKQCQDMCRNRVCWPTPEEAKALIDAGYGARLMMDYWVSDPDINILCPAISGYESQQAPWTPTGRCTFFTDEGLCEINHLKPLEGKKARHDLYENNKDMAQLHGAVASLWMGSSGLVDDWATQFKKVRYHDEDDNENDNE